MTEGLHIIAQKLRDDVARFLKKPRSFFRMGSPKEQSEICCNGINPKAGNTQQTEELDQMGENE